MSSFTSLKTTIQSYIRQNGNNEITGALLQEVLLAMVATLGDAAINDLEAALAAEVTNRTNAVGDEALARYNADTSIQTGLGAEIFARQNADTALQGLIDGITDNIENGYVYAGIATPSSTPATGKVFYLALTAGTYTNFGSTEVSQGINILKYNGSAWSLDAFIGIDDTPVPNSPKLVKSGGIAENIGTLIAEGEVMLTGEETSNIDLFYLTNVSSLSGKDLLIITEGVGEGKPAGRINFSFLSGSTEMVVTTPFLYTIKDSVSILKATISTSYIRGAGKVKVSVYYAQVNPETKHLFERLNGYSYEGIAKPSTTPVTFGKVFYIATQAGTYTNFNGLELTKGINILRYDGSVWLLEKIIGISDEFGFNDNLVTNREIESLFGKEEIPVSITIKNGHYWNSQTNTAVDTVYASYSLYEPIEIDHTKTYKINIYSTNSAKQNPILLVDNNYQILNKYTRNPLNSLHTTVITPEDTVNATYILLTTQKNMSSYTSVSYLSLANIEKKVNELYGGIFDFKDKNIAIIGDSISTNGNWSVSNPLGNVPEIIIEDEDVGVELSAYATSYDVGVIVGGHEITSEDVGVEITFTPTAEDVGKVVGKPLNRNDDSYKVWWEVAMDVLGFHPIPVAWSGSSITNHAGGANPEYAWHPSQIRKCGIRIPGTMTRIAPDMVIIYRGTNDFSHSPYTRLTNYLTTYPQTIPATDVVEIDGVERFGYIEGLVMTIDRVRTAYPEAKIVLCTLNYFHRVESGQPSRNGINTIYEYNNAIRAVADYFGCQIIEFDKDGITYANAVSGGYYSDSNVDNPTHPNTKGHKVMGNKAIRDLVAQSNSLT